MRLQLLVKGPRVDAVRAAEAHGIDTLAASIPHSGEDDLTIIWLDDATAVERGRVVAWFVEPPHSPPFPSGTLLHYRFIEND